MGRIIEVFPNGSDSVTVDLSVGGGAALYPHLDVQIDRSHTYVPTQAHCRSFSYNRDQVPT
jgi:hypothetical protein